MGLSFLAPLFAIGLAAVAVPLLVHLVHKERKESTPFPSLAFLRKVPYRHSSRRRFRDLVLLALRVSALALLIAAFARPVIARSRQSATGSGGGRERVILVDRSFSMKYGDRWTRARAAVTQVIGQTTPRDRVTIVPFDLTARAVHEPSADKAQLAAAFDTVTTVEGGTRLAPALTIARRVLSASALPQREVVVVTDFQRSSFDLTEEARLPAGTIVTPVDVVSGDVVDRSVRSVELRRAPTKGREMISVHARLGEVGPAVRGVEASLVVAGRVIETRAVDLPANGGAAVDFAAIPVPEVPQPAEVRLRGDALPGDDRYSFILARTPVVSVLVANANDMAPDADLFLQRALEIGDRPPFDVLVKRAGAVTPADIASRQVVVLNDTWLSDALVGGLTRHVVGGGGLLVAAGQRMDARESPARAGLLPAPVTAPTDRDGERGGVLGYLDATHPALSLFGASRSGDLSAARFFRYRAVNATEGVLARFDDGAGALAERRVGRGRVLQFGSSLDGYWNDLPRQPVFLPFLHQLMRYVADYRERRDAYSVGEAVDAGAASDSVPNDSSHVARVATAPSGRRVRYGSPGDPPALVPAEAGIYEIRRAGAPGERPRLVAVNIDPRELDFSRFEPLRLVEAARAPDAVALAADSTGGATLQERERDQSLWWYILWVVTAALVAEALLARRISMSRPSST